MFSLAWAWRLRPSNPHAKLIALYLSDVCDHQGHGVAVRADVRKWSCLPEDEFRDALLDLGDAGITFSLGESLDHLYYRLPAEALPVRVPMAAATKTRATVGVDGWLYVITAGGKTKVGISRKLYDRIIWLQSGNPEKITLAASFRGPLTEIRELELVVHTAMINRRVAGEWFDAPPDAAIAVVNAEIGRLQLRITRASDPPA